MNFRDLQYLIALTDYAHFGKAAEACFVSQPALSMQIKKLEDTLGVQLIERNNKTCLLTDIGKTIAEQAREIINRLESMRETARQAADPLSGKLNLGVIPTLAPYLLPHIIPGITKSFPKVTTYLMEEQTAKLLEKIKQGKCDAALLAIPVADDDLKVLPLFEEEFMLALYQSHPLAKHKSISQKDLENKILFLLEDGHCMREQALSVCHLAHASEAKAFQATSLETLRHMVASKAGITLMPKLSCKSKDGISYIPFSKPQPKRVIGLVFRLSSPKKLLLESLADQIRLLMEKSNLVKTVIE